ncbi:MAG: PEP-CTERM sorting domain-containing protein [Akkermansiaceae bacterium]|nr:PEP-CTERM sorting domain-containing protein [Akkermansiaceae bacterium]MCF7730148.1 PEP-CTERM sorting domain-containing protein [Akkermansiaceae bacterium]
MKSKNTRILALLPMAAALAVTPVSAASLIVNGSFEIGTHDSGSAHDAYLPDGWTGPAGYAWYWDGSLNAPASQDGTRHMNLNNDTGLNTLSQSFTVGAGTEYTVSYWTVQRGNGLMFTTLSVDAGAVTGADAFVTGITGSGTSSINQLTVQGEPAWTQYGFTFTPDTAATATITLGNVYDGGTGDNDGVFLDNVSVTAIPEPTTALLGGLGLLALLRRRRA